MVEAKASSQISSLWKNSHLPSQRCFFKVLKYLADKQDIKQLLSLLCKAGPTYYRDRIKKNESLKNKPGYKFNYFR